MAEEEHPVSIPLRAKDELSRVFEKAAHAAEKLGEKIEKTVDKVTEMGAAIAGISGAFGFERMVESGRESLEQIGKLSKLTDMAADHVAAMRDTFEQSGLGAEQMARSMTMLSKKALQLDENGKAITAEARRWGVDLKKGPEEALYSIADAVQKHRIGQAEVMKLTGASRENLGGMMELLEGGREELEKNVRAAEQLNKHLAGNEALERFKKFHAASEKIHEAWRRLSERVVVALAPALTKLADKLSGWMSSLGDHADRFAKILTKGFELAVAHAKTLGKIMLANSLLQKTTGTGLIGFAPKAMGLAGKIFRAGGGIGNAVGGIGAETGGLASMIGPLGTVIPMILRLAGGVTGIGLVVGAIILVVKHLDVLKEKLGAVASRIWSTMQRLWSSISSLFSEDSAIGRGIRVLFNFWMKYVNFLLSGFEKLIGLAADFIDFLDVGITSLMEHKTMERVREERREKSTLEAMKSTGFIEYNAAKVDALVSTVDKAAQMHMRLSEANSAAVMKYLESTEAYAKTRQGGGTGILADERYRKLKTFMDAQKARAPEEGAAPHAGVYQDFRGSRFDIEQKFAEGFDPDRVAIAFANDLASQGEKRFVSGLTPAFSIR